MVRVLVFPPLLGSPGGLGTDLLGEAGSFVLAVCWQLDDSPQQSRRLCTFDSVVADQQLLVERLVDLPPGLWVAGPVELAEVVDQGLLVDQVLDDSLERCIELAGLVLDGPKTLLDALDLGPEQIGGELVVVVELEQLGAFVHEFLALLVQPVMVGSQADLAVGQGLLDQRAQLGNFVGVQ